MQSKLKQILLTLLLSAGDDAQTEGVVKTGLRASFPGVAFPESELTGAIRACEAAGWIAGTRDELLGNVWALTPKGKIKAQQIA